MNKIEIDDKSFDLFLDYAMIEKRTRLMGIQLNVDYENKLPVFIGVLNGSVMFMADLMKEITIGCEFAFVKVSSYHGETKSSGKINEEYNLSMDIKDRDVVVVEDIVDTGKTLKYLLDQFKGKKPASLKVATLLLKPDALETDLPEITYVGFEITNEFVVGYGLDYKGLGRNLKNIYKLSK